MSKITSELLASLAPATADRVRDRFLPFFNEALPRYQITTELRVSAFLATVVFESNYLRATKEGHAAAGTKARAAQDKYWSSGYYGRGLIQTTHKANYQAFNDFIHKAFPDAPDFVVHPEQLEQPNWAVESACYFWQSNKLNPLADKSKFHEIQGITNRGDASKEAWGYNDRFKIYKKCLAQLPNGFVLDSELSPAVVTPPIPPTTVETNAETADPKVPSDPPKPASPADPMPTVVIPPRPSYNGKGLKQTLIDGAKSLLPANFTLQAVPDVVKQINDFPDWAKLILSKLALILLICTVGWVLYHIIAWLAFLWESNEKRKIEATANTDPTKADVKVL